MQKLHSQGTEDLRAEAREWLRANVPTGARAGDGCGLRRNDTEWQRKWFEGGWAGVSWPEEQGGRELD